MRKLAKKKTPWHRRRTPFSKTPDEIYYFDNLAEQRPKFRDRGDSNRYLDILTKSAALKASPSVVALISYSGEQEIIQGSGTVIENSDCGSIVLTSANLIRRPTDMGVMENILAENLKVIVHLCDGNSYEGVLCAHDFHYNLAAIKFQSETLVASATLAHINDSISLAPNQNSFELRPHSNSSTLTPGDRVIALGRYFVKPFDLMAAPGEYWLERSSYDCKELFMAKCVITRCGDGGPLINDSGEVIGITYYDYGLTPFMPINIAYKWWQYYKAYGKYCRPSLGMEATDLYAVDLAIIERVILKFPSVSKGVIVEKVIPGSSADLAGICVNDVIVKCGGKTVQSLLQEQWKKVIARKLIQHGNTQHKLKPEIVTKCCARILCGGVYRMKEHWIGGRRNAKKCTRAPGDVRKEMEEYMEAKKKAREMENYFQAVIDSDEDSVDDIVQVSKSNKGSCASTPSLKTKVSTSRPKGPFDLYMIPDPETAVMKRKGKGQQKINDI